MRAQAVIGANFGDEGKGLVTDYLCREAGGKSCVVRHNGTAQATHTVTRPDGMRHRFSHFGSGTLAGASTFIAGTYYAHPAALAKEWDELDAMGITVQNLFIDPRSPLVTPMDIIANRVMEAQRGDGKHGSCGMGFFWAWQRERMGTRMTVGDLLAGPNLVSDIASDWTAESIGDAAAYELFQILCEDFERGMGMIRRRAVIVPWENLMAEMSWSSMIFESGQGLALDPCYGSMPHCTPSDCGLYNPAHMAAGAGFDGIDAYYVTRTYLTRHGAGPFEAWPQDKAMPEFYDAPNVMKDADTNKPNPWQDDIRYAPHQLVEMAERIRKDVHSARNIIQVSANLAVTWCDSYGGKALDFAMDNIAPLALVSNGPCAEDVIRVQSEMMV